MGSLATASPSPRAQARNSLRLAAIDIGSNRLHMVVAQADRDGGLTTLWSMKEMIGLGRMSFPSRRLSKEAMDRALACLARFKQAAVQREAEQIIVVATAAVREAENGGDFIERAKTELNLNARIVSAREEARLIYVAVRHDVSLKRAPHLIIDIGGGSAEFIVASDRHVYLLESRKLGAARMTAAFVRSDPLSDANRSALLQHYDQELSRLCKRIEELKPIKVLATSGTMENIANMCEGPRSSSAKRAESSPQVIERPRFNEVLQKLLKSNSDDRANIPGLDGDRKDQIIAGALLVDEIFKRLKLRRIHICESALREGILLDYLDRHLPELTIRREVPDPRRRSVLDLARRCQWHKSHSTHVSSLMLKLFDELKNLHGLGAPERELFEYASLLHDIGWHIASTGHHKHSSYLILNGDLKNFTEEEIGIIACIARYHRKSGPKAKHPTYCDLSARGKRIVNVGASLLRLADGLDRSHSSVVQNLRCKLNTEKDIECHISAKSDAQLEVWGATRKSQLFEKVFKRQISFHLNGRTVAP
jgi:exopolyphosphatase/guanosine-5'-triphosphate,3'-diphosphate pyrophosphatase